MGDEFSSICGTAPVNHAGDAFSAELGVGVKKKIVLLSSERLIAHRERRGHRCLGKADQHWT